MRTTVTLDDQLFDQAAQLTGVRERGALLREALRALIARESAKRLAQLGAFETEEAAKSAWNKLALEYGALFTGKGQVIQAAESAGRNFYRLRAEGFETDADTRGFCAALSTDMQCVPVTIR